MTFPMLVVRKARVMESLSNIQEVQVSDEEMLDEIGQEAKSRLGMSGGLEEFQAAYRDGVLPDTLAANELAMMFHFVELSGKVPA